MPSGRHRRYVDRRSLPIYPCAGHATIGGLGPLSRQWGTALDHVDEVEVVLADSSIVRANNVTNSDVFWVCFSFFQ